MNVQLLKSLGLCLSITLSMVACQQKGSGGSGSQEPQYVTLGDPLANIADTELNPKSFLTVQNIETFNGYEINSFSIRERVPVEMVPSDDSASELQQTQQSETFKAEPAVVYKVTKEMDSEGQARWVLYPIEDKDDVFLYFYPSKSNSNILELTSWGFKGEDPQPVNMLHYSLKRDGSAFSFLFTFQHPKYQKVLHELIFTTMRSAAAKEVLSAKEKSYKYSYSNSLKVRWPQQEKLNLVFCGTQSKNFSGSLGDAIDHWKQSLAGRLDLEVLYASKKCPPFSDLNFHGVYFVENYNIWHSMYTYALGTEATQRIFDGDIMVNMNFYRRAWAKNGMANNSKAQQDSFGIYITMAHEVGHFLGLDHNYGTPSVMSYEDNQRFTVYDREAVQALYPRK